MRVLLLGASGTIGHATAKALVARGHEVTALVREGSARANLPGLAVHVGAVADPAALAAALEGAETVVSCMASRTGRPADAWAVDHAAHVAVLEPARAAGVSQFVLLSALCVQKPQLAFQHAKLAFEGALAASGLRYSIVRPTAFFKSLSGQVARVKGGRPFLVFGDGTLTACKPIADADLADFLAGCLDDPARWDRILPIGGPGPAITPREQGERLFAMLGRPARFRHVPVAMLDAIIAGLSLGGRLSPSLADKAELARIGRYYATESMLMLDPATGRYAADATPETGTRTLWDHYADLLSGKADAGLGDHAVFDRGAP